MGGIYLTPIRSYNYKYFYWSFWFSYDRVSAAGFLVEISFI
jgi:hypothetical protein